MVRGSGDLTIMAHESGSWYLGSGGLDPSSTLLATLGNVIAYYREKPNREVGRAGNFSSIAL